jgi:polyisoprenoid-binding protein YceI
VRISRHLSPALIALSAAFLLSGCADPTEGKPEAVVNEYQQEPAAEPPAAASDEMGATESYVITPDTSKISFVGSKVTGSHDGGFNEFDGEVTVVDGDPTKSSIVVDIDTTSLWTDTERLTGHLKSADFFEVEKYPTATFRSTSIEDAGDHYVITGNLDLHGVTKNISFPAEIEVSEGAVSARSEFALKRFDFGIVYPGKPDDLIREDVLVKLDLNATRADDSMAEVTE